MPPSLLRRLPRAQVANCGGREFNRTGARNARESNGIGISKPDALSPIWSRYSSCNDQVCPVQFESLGLNVQFPDIDVELLRDYPFPHSVHREGRAVTQSGGSPDVNNTATEHEFASAFKELFCRRGDTFAVSGGACIRTDLESYECCTEIEPVGHLGHTRLAEVLVRTLRVSWPAFRICGMLPLGTESVHH